MVKMHIHVYKNPTKLAGLVRSGHQHLIESNLNSLW